MRNISTFREKGKYIWMLGTMVVEHAMINVYQQLK